MANAANPYEQSRLSGPESAVSAEQWADTQPVVGPGRLPALLSWLAVGLCAVLTVPVLTEAPTSGVDPSWKLGLHLAREHGLIVGSDLHFNYGPWGFLTVPLTYAYDLWLASATFHLFVHFSMFALLGLEMRNNMSRWPLLALAPLFLFEPLLEYQLVLAVLLLLRWASTRDGSWMLIASAAAAPALFVKFSAGLAALAMVGAVMVALVLNGRIRAAACALVGYVAGLLVCGFVALGTLGALLEFIVMSWEISAGYAVAAERHGPLWQPLLSVASVGVLAIAVVTSQRDRLLFALPAAALFAVAFKHAFVRHDTHGPIALVVGSILACWIALELRQRARWIGGLAAAMFVVGAHAAEPVRLLDWPAQMSSRLVDASEIFSSGATAAHREQVVQSLREELPFPDEILPLVEGRSVDVMTLQTSLLAAWSWDWTPRPVLQSYVVTTERLDAADASHFASDDAPDRLVVSLQAIDTRHPFMDSPLTWRAIRMHYEPMARDRRWVVLARRAQPREVVERDLGHFLAEMNTPIEVPQPDSGHVEMRVQVEPTLLGKIVGASWKRPDVRLGLLREDGPDEPRRLVPDTVSKPFPLANAWPDYPDQALDVFMGRVPPPPPAIAFYTQGNWAWKPARVSFVQVEWRDADDS